MSRRYNLLKLNIQKIFSDINKTNQEKLTNDLIITNMPETTNVEEDFWNLVSTINASIEKSDVASINLFHKSNERDTKKGRPTTKLNTVKVKFNNYRSKVELIAKKKATGAVLTEQLSMNKSESIKKYGTQAIYFRDHLTNYGLNGLNDTQSSTKNCEIFLRHDKKAKIIKVSSQQDVDNLALKYNIPASTVSSILH